MANKNLFQNKSVVSETPSTNGHHNVAGGRAYSLSNEHALCQYVVTGTFNQTFYATPNKQLDKIEELCKDVPNQLLAKAAIYGHNTARMKDVPAYLLAVLASRAKYDKTALYCLKRSFNRTITNVKMLCNFVQIIRSGKTGRRSFGTAIKRLIQEWIANQSNDKLFSASIGHGNPSLADVIKMVRPNPVSQEQDNTFAYLLGKLKYNADNGKWVDNKGKEYTGTPLRLPQNVKDFEYFKADNNYSLPNIPFRALTNCNLSEDNWKYIALTMPWNTLRMNLNMLAKNGVFNDEEIANELAKRLANAESVRKFNAFPYQLMTTYNTVKDKVPTNISLALQDALEVATENIPTLDTNVAICIDLSGSMHSPVTGYRSNSTTTTCVDVAALIAASILRTNPNSTVVAWASHVKEVVVNPRDSVITNADKFKNCGVGGGTAAQLGLQHLNEKDWRGDAVIYVSDNQSWMRSDNPHGTYWENDATEMADEWAKYVERNQKAKLVCIDIQPYMDAQVPDSDNVLNIGGFSDAVWEPIANFIHNKSVDFVNIVKEVEL